MIDVVRGGPRAFMILREMLRRAKREIMLQCYIMRNDRIAEVLINDLIAAVNRGVAVSVLLDSFGSGDFPEELMQKMSKGGVNCCWFNPIFSFQSLYLGRRLHHKVVIVDGDQALISGFNYASEYLSCNQQLGYPWLDFGLFITGPSVQRLEKHCRWLLISQQSILKNPSQKLKQTSQMLYDGGPRDRLCARIALNDRLIFLDEVRAGFNQAIAEARTRIIVMNSYFLPSFQLRKALIRARERGVQVDLVLAGRSDLPTVRRAMRYLYHHFLGAQISIHEWPHSVHHAKVVLVDGFWLSLGSYNLDYLSTFANVETNVEVKDTIVAQRLLTIVEEIIAESVTLTWHDFKQKYRWKQWVSSFLSFYFLRFMMRVYNFIIPPKSPFERSTE